MLHAEGRSIAIPDFTFRMASRDVELYRRALGAASESVPLGLALRALASETVTTALRNLAGKRHLIHVAQEYRVEQPLRPDVDYSCRVCIRSTADDRLRVEQHLSYPTGFTCLVAASDIVLVATT